MIDLHFVTPGLAVGARYPMEAAALLAREHGIARVIDLRIEACDDEAVLRLHGIRLLHLPTEDCHAMSWRRLRDGVAFAVEGLDRGEGVFVHCQYGIGRSALLTLCVLVARGDPPLAAMERIKGARPAVSPSPEQLEAFMAYCARQRTDCGASWAVPTLERLGAIAWSHLQTDDEPVDLEVATASASRAR